MNIELPNEHKAEWLLWQSKVAMTNGNWKEVGVYDPEGKYYELSEGEKFIINKREGGDYQAVVIGPNGQKRILKERVVEKTEVQEIKEIIELNEKTKIAAEYLNHLNSFFNFLNINPGTGTIEYNKPELGIIEDEKVKSYQEHFTKLLTRFSERNANFIEKTKKDPNILDIKEIAGAIIVTYNSSKGEPELIKTEGFKTGSDEKARGSISTATENYLGLVVVDINKEKRKDGVSATTSGIHELHHYSLSICDYLMSEDELFGMQSSHRKGRVTALFGSNRDRINTKRAFFNDKEYYSKFLEREIDFEKDLPRIETQLSYLDELHSSFLQKKENWFNATERVYSERGEGKHWELVGDHIDDINSSKKLLAYLQGFYILDQIAISYSKRTIIGEGQKNFIKDFTSEFNKVGSLIGVSRTVRQAQLLIEESWNNFTSKHPIILNSSKFINFVSQWETTVGVENLKKILLKE